ncbi:hypothetical protein, partial [Escherichia coli]|uniref:hypothetical protein n=1 Tax=Escherichia coli TaxID=562 RepID=UPI001BC8AEC3
ATLNQSKGFYFKAEAGFEVGVRSGGSEMFKRGRISCFSSSFFSAEKAFLILSKNPILIGLLPTA